jgi:DNA mismatch endonuclease, patch repair protein
MDQVSPVVRSRMMRAIRSKNTEPELLVRRVLHAAGYRFRLHRRDLPGTPDIVLPRYRTVVQVNGCWWHGHNCSRGRRRSSTNVEYWGPKLERNIRRQATADAAMAAIGWSVVTIWECDIEAGIVSLLATLHGRYKRQVDTT